MTFKINSIHPATADGTFGDNSTGGVHIVQSSNANIQLMIIAGVALVVVVLLLGKRNGF